MESELKLEDCLNFIEKLDTKITTMDDATIKLVKIDLLDL